MKELVTVGAVHTHTHTHTHTDTLENKIARNDKFFRIPENMRNLEEKCEK